MLKESVRCIQLPFFLDSKHFEARICWVTNWCDNVTFLISRWLTVELQQPMIALLVGKQCSLWYVQNSVLIHFIIYLYSLFWFMFTMEHHFLQTTIFKFCADKYISIMVTASSFSYRAPNPLLRHRFHR